VLVLECIVHFLLLLLLLRSGVLFFELAVEFLADEALALSVAHEGLLLLFVVEQSVELLDGHPLVVLVEVGEAFRLCLLAGEHAHALKLVLLGSL